MANNNYNLDEVLEYFSNLKTRREKWNGIWEELRKYVCPQTKSTKTIFDSTSIWSREQLASGLQSLLVNQAQNWFNIKIDLDSTSEEEQAEVPEIKAWAQLVEQTILEVFNNPASNFYNQIHEFFLNLAAFGTAIFYVEEDLELSGGLFFRNINLTECYFEEDRLGLVNRMHRLFTLPIRVAVNKWPECKSFQEKLTKTPDERVEILHVVTPTEEKNKKRLLAYESKYIYLEGRELISESGYSYFPFLVTRWIKEEGEAYGYAPAHHVLPDIKLLNSLRQITLKVAQKQLDPPLLVPKDGYYLPLYTTPGSVNFYRNGMADKIVPLTGMENIVPTEVEQNQCREAIFKAFYVDIFRMQKEHKEMTAMEVQIRTEEQMRMMAPMVGRIETELLNPLINAVYKTLVKYNKLPMIEGQMIPTDLKLEYVSPLSRAQKSAAMSSIEQVLGFFQRSGIVNLVPEIYDNINWDECFKLFFELRGAPRQILKSQQEVSQIRRQRQLRQLQQAQQLQQQGTNEIIN